MLGGPVYSSPSAGYRRAPVADGSHGSGPFRAIRPARCVRAVSRARRRLAAVLLIVHAVVGQPQQVPQMADSARRTDDERQGLTQCAHSRILV